MYNKFNNNNNIKIAEKIFYLIYLKKLGYLNY